jgi:hypothetical protein
MISGGTVNSVKGCMGNVNAKVDGDEVTPRCLCYYILLVLLGVAIIVTHSIDH